MFPYNYVSDFSINISERHESLREEIKKFVEKELKPRAKNIEESDNLPDDLLRLAASYRLTGLGVPRELCGRGEDQLSIVIFIEEVSKVCPSFATAIMVQYLFMLPIILFGSIQQKLKYVSCIARGEKFGAHAVTEVEAGSDIAGIRTTARREGDGWIINGQKRFITFADKADYLTILARTSDLTEQKQRWRGLTMFIIDRTFEGVEIGPKIKVMGLNGIHPFSLYLNNVWVPNDSVLGKVDEGFKIAVRAYNYGRVYAAAQAVGIAQSVLEKCIDYSSKREAFGQPLISFQGVQFPLVDLLSSVISARLLTYWAAMALDKRGDDIIAPALAKLYATEVAEKTALKGIEIHGGVGVTQEGLIERFLRDSEVIKIYEGTPAILRLTIIHQILKLISKNVQSEK